MYISDDERLLTVKEAADVIGGSASTLNKLRVAGGGPAFVYIGNGRGGVRYQLGDLKAWIASRKRRNTSHAA